MGDEREHRDPGGERKGHSEDRKGLADSRFTKHFDESGNETGRSTDESGLFGDRFTQHRDERGDDIGRSRTERDNSGNEYTQHFNKYGERTGRSERKRDSWGDEYIQHYDAAGNETGRTADTYDTRERKKREERYRQRESESQGYSASSESNSSNDGWKAIFALLAVGIACAVVMSPFIPLGFLSLGIFVWGTQHGQGEFGAIAGLAVFGIGLLLLWKNRSFRGAYFIAYAAVIEVIAYIGFVDTPRMQWLFAAILAFGIGVLAFRGMFVAWRWQAPPEEARSNAWLSCAAMSGGTLALIAFLYAIAPQNVNAALRFAIPNVPRSASQQQVRAAVSPEPTTTAPDHIANISMRVWVTESYNSVPDADVRHFPGPQSPVAIYMQMDGHARDDVVAARLSSDDTVLVECPDSTQISGGTSQYWCPPQLLSAGNYRWDVFVNGIRHGSYDFDVGAETFDVGAISNALKDDASLTSGGIIGHWVGEIWREGREPKRFVMSIDARQEDGTFQGTAEEPATLMGTIDWTISGTLNPDGSLSFTKASGSGLRGSHEGTVSEDGQTITGTWRYHGREGQFRLSRVEQ